MFFAPCLLFTVNMDQLGPTFRKKLKQLGIEKQVEAAGICATWEQNASKILGDLSVETKALHYKNKVLTIGTTCSAVSSEVKIFEPQILALFESKGYMVERVKSKIIPEI